MRNAGLEEAQAGIKTAGENVNHNIFSNNKLMYLLIQQILIKYLLRAHYFAGHYEYTFNFKSL